MANSVMNKIDIESAIAEAKKVLQDDYNPNLDVLELYDSVNQKHTARRDPDGAWYQNAVSSQALEKHIDAIIALKIDQWLEANMPDIVRDVLLKKIDKLKNE